MPKRGSRRTEKYCASNDSRCDAVRHGRTLRPMFERVISNSMAFIRAVAHSVARARPNLEYGPEAALMFNVASRTRRCVLTGVALALMVSPMGVRAGAPQAGAGSTDASLAGVLDTHAHVDPDSAEPSTRGVD